MSLLTPCQAESPPNEQRVTASHRRMAVIEICKGFAILLVVAGHLVKAQTLVVPDWYGLFKTKVYLFHMPLFMFLSGYVYFLAGHQTRALSHYGQYVLKRADRLLVPFLAIAFILTAGKIWFAGILSVDAAPESWHASLLSLVFHTENSFIFTIWYLFVLFAISILTPWVVALFKGHLGWVFAATCALHFAHLPDILFLNRIAEFFVFFIAGGLANSVHFLNLRPKPTTLFIGIAAFASTLLMPLDRHSGLLPCGLLACLLVPHLLNVLPEGIQRALHYLGQRSMSIYLFNVAAIGLAKGLYLRTFGYSDDRFFLLLAAILMASGVGLPLLIRWLSGRAPFTSVIHKYIA